MRLISRLRVWGMAVCLVAPTTAAVAQSNQSNPAAALARCTTPVPRDGKARERFLELNRRVREAGHKAQVVFIGDSITQGWEDAGKELWAKYYEHRHALNLGISSDHTQHVLWRLENGNLEGLDPKVAVVLIGVNNVPDDGNSPGDILAGIKAVVGQIREKLPRTKVLLLGIFPFHEDFSPQRGKALQVNQALHGLEDGKWIHFLDFGHRFLEPDGKIAKDTMRDFLHPSARGYRIWAEAMEPKLAGLLGDAPIAP